LSAWYNIAFFVRRFNSGIFQFYFLLFARSTAQPGTTIFRNLLIISKKNETQQSFFALRGNLGVRHFLHVVLG
jgi:hypothetical protein